jgi:membrane-associated phospholipid phosphatase
MAGAGVCGGRLVPAPVHGRTVRCIMAPFPTGGMAVGTTARPRLPPEAEPRLPGLWLRPAVAARLAIGFLLLAAVGVGATAVLAGTTPTWATGQSLEDAADLDVTPQAEALDLAEGDIDARVADWISGRRPGWLVGLATFTAHAAKIWVVVPLLAVVGGLVWYRTRRGSVFWVSMLGVLGGLALSVVVKFIVFRPRPPDEVAAVEAFGPSYPSGHVIRAAAAYGALAWFVAATTTSRGRQAAAWAAAGVIVAVVGAARVYEGAHWLTDVLVSLVLGGGWLAVVLAATGLLRPRDTRARRGAP